MSLMVKDILNIGQTRLTGADCIDPKIDAELLLCHMIGIERTQLFMHWGLELSDDQCEAYFALLDRRGSGVPLQHITGEQEFMGLSFRVSNKVLIPRQETEVLVETALELIRERKFRSVLDLCTGSGAIAIALARSCAVEKKLNKVEITASDISDDALAVARRNAKKLGADKVKFFYGDLFAPFCKKVLHPKFDLIVSNPPYIQTGDILFLQREVKDHEPILALDGGDDGLCVYRRIIAEAPEYLKKGGVLLLEIGCDQGAAVEALAAETEKFTGTAILQDLTGRDRIAVMELASPRIPKNNTIGK